MKRLCQLSTCRGFTLIELLVVVGALMLLAVFALPTLARNRNRAHDTVDLGNYHRILQATHSYTADNNGFLPGNGWGTVSASWAHAANLPTGGGVSGPGFDLALTRQRTSVTNGQLYPYIQSLATFMCPADRFDIRFYARSVYITSYKWNGAVCGYGKVSPNSYKLSQFKPNAILQWEADEKTPFFFNDCSTYPDEGISSRHGDTLTVGMFSGGIDSLPLSKYYTSEFAGAAGQRGTTIPTSLLPNRMWCSPGSATGRY